VPQQRIHLTAPRRRLAGALVLPPVLPLAVRAAVPQRPAAHAQLVAAPGGWVRAAPGGLLALWPAACMGFEWAISRRRRLYFLTAAARISVICSWRRRPRVLVPCRGIRVQTRSSSASPTRPRPPEIILRLASPAICIDSIFEQPATHSRSPAATKACAARRRPLHLVIRTLNFLRTDPRPVAR
jgi:hypothetical protein